MICSTPNWLRVTLFEVIDLAVRYYLIYPIAGLLCLLALGGFNTKHPIVVTASMISLALNGYAVFAFVWWPIPASIVSDLILKRLFGDPGAGN